MLVMVVFFISFIRIPLPTRLTLFPYTTLFRSPIRVTCWDNEHQPQLEMACTYDISQHGARIVGLRSAQKPGEIVAVERGRNKTFCRIVWIGQNNSERHGQIGLQCVETDKSMWESE